MKRHSETAAARRKTRLLILLPVIGLLAAALLGGLAFKQSTVSQFAAVLASQSNNSIFYDLDGIPFHTIRGAEDRRYVKLDRISRNLQLSVVAIEDGRFFQHPGFDPIRIASVVLRLFKTDASLQGASTITQQLIKLTLLSPDISLRRKIREIFMAVAIELEYSKSDILEYYLNKVYLGHGNYGVENASQHFLAKSAADLTLAESAFLAGLIKKPEGYSPFVDVRMTRLRQVLVLKRLRRLGWIGEKEYQSALGERLLIRERRKNERGLAPHFTNQVLLHLKNLYGDRTVYGGGLHIYTTLDGKLQRTMEKVIQQQIAGEGGTTEVAGVAIDPATGFVKALVGGVDFSRSEFNRATQAYRQPGSSFKPILYATALANGIKPNDVFWDEPTQYSRTVDDEIEIYEPGNISGEHLGQITMAYALKVSNNVVSVQILNQIGIPALMEKAKGFGLTLPPNQGLGLALGCGETTRVQLVDAYAVFANQGLRNPPVYLLRITDSQGQVLYTHRPQSEIEVLTRTQAYQMNHLLQEVVNYGTGRNAKINRQSGGKTGTSDANRDAWYIGYTPELVTGFWIGNDNNTPMAGETGGRTPALLWRSFMEAQPVPEVLKSFAINEDVAEYRLCNQSGQLATEHCPNASWYALLPQDAPQNTCPLHNEPALAFRICRLSGKLATEYCPIADITTETYTPGTEPEAFCDLHGPGEEGDGEETEDASGSFD